MPQTWCRDIDHELKNFWWGFKASKSLMSWKYVFLLKKDGGLGIKVTTEVNQALVSKLSRKVMTKNDSLWVRVLSGKYLKQQDFSNRGSR